MGLNKGINDEFHRAFPKNYAKQENVDDSTEAIQDFLNSGDDTLPSAYISNIALSDAERDRAEGEITMVELEYSLFKKNKGSRIQCTWHRWVHSELVKEILVKFEIDNL